MALRFRVLGSGSAGNATLVEAQATRILIDAGLGPADPRRAPAVGGRRSRLARRDLRLPRARRPRARSGGFLRPLGRSPLRDPRHLRGGRLRSGGHRGLRRDGRGGAAPGRARCASPAVAVPHDAAEPLAFVVAADGASLGHATDFGHVSRGVVEAFRGCDALLVESNYDPDMLRRGPYPWSLKERILGGHGHLSNGDVARFLAEGLGRVVPHRGSRAPLAEEQPPGAGAHVRRRGAASPRPDGGAGSS